MNSQEKLYFFNDVYQNGGKIPQKGGVTRNQGKIIQSVFNSRLSIEDRVRLASDTKQMLGASSNFFFTMLTFIYEVIIVKSLGIINVFYGTLNSELQGLQGTSMDSNKNDIMMKSIEKVINNPEFKKQWAFFSGELAQLLGQLLDKVKVQTDKQLNSISNDVVNLVGLNTKSMVMGVGMGVLDGICAIPPFFPICELMLFAGTGSKLTSQTLMTFLRTVNKMADSFEVVFGGEAEKVASFIKKWKDIYSNLNNMVENATNIPVNIINNASGSISNMTGDLVGNASANISKRTGDFAGNASANISKRTGDLFGNASKSISKRTGDIMNASKDISKRTGDLVGNASANISKRTGDIMDASKDISKRTGDFASNASANISKRTGDLVGNASANISKKTGDIMNASKDISKRTGDFASNASKDISKRTGDFAGNASANISKRTGDIMDASKDISKRTGDFASNTSANISKRTGDFASNASKDISKRTGDFAGNASANISKRTGDIMNASKDISKRTGDLVGNASANISKRTGDLFGSASKSISKRTGDMKSGIMKKTGGKPRSRKRSDFSSSKRSNRRTRRINLHQR